MVGETSRQTTLTVGTKNNTKPLSARQMLATGHLEASPSPFSSEGTALHGIRRRSGRDNHLERIIDLSDVIDHDEITAAGTNILPLKSPPPPVDPVTNRYYVDCLLKRRARRRYGGKRRVVSYLVKWEGYGPEHNSWVLKRHIHADLVEAFESRQQKFH